MTTTFTLIVPRYTHDCDVCRFVGHDGDADCYVCGDSVVRRVSDDAPEYSSFPRDIAVRIPLYARVLDMEAALVRLEG